MTVGEPPAAPPATPGRRLAARLVDGAILLGVLLVLALLLTAVVRGTDPWVAGAATSAERTHRDEVVDLVVAPVVVLLVLAPLVVTWWCSCLRVRRRGASPGKQLLGLQVRRLDGGPVTWGQAWLRWGTPELLGLVTAGLGALVDAAWLLWDPRRQTLHDKLAGTVVVDVRDARVPRPS